MVSDIGTYLLIIFYDSNKKKLKNRFCSQAQKPTKKLFSLQAMLKSSKPIGDPKPTERVIRVSAFFTYFRPFPKTVGRVSESALDASVKISLTS